MMSKAPQEARMAIRVLLSVAFFKEGKQENDLFLHCSVESCCSPHRNLNQ